MELKSDPNNYETVTVTDLDVAFPGDLQAFTLREGEGVIEMDEQDDTLTIQFAHGGTILFNLRHAHWVARKQRTIRVLVPEGQSAKSAVPQLQTPTRTEQ